MDPKGLKTTVEWCTFDCRDMRQLVDVDTGIIWANAAQHMLPPNVRAQFSGDNRHVQEQLR